MENMYHETRCLDWFQRLRTFLRQPAFQELVPPEAIEAFERTAYSTFPPQTKLRLELNHWMQQAQAHLVNGQIDQAARIAQSLVDQQPSFAPGWELAGVVCFQLNRAGDAEQAFRRGLQLAPQNANMHNNLGVALRMQGRMDEAIQSLQHALQLSPNFGEAYQNMGDTLFSLQRLPEAREMYERALQVNPNLAQARANLDQLLQRLQPTTAQ
jgi:tetratricopeptide (TPR) repeat protein